MPSAIDTRPAGCPRPSRMIQAIRTSRCTDAFTAAGCVDGSHMTTRKAPQASAASSISTPMRPMPSTSNQRNGSRPALKGSIERALRIAVSCITNVGAGPPVWMRPARSFCRRDSNASRAGSRSCRAPVGQTASQTRRPGRADDRYRCRLRRPATRRRGKRSDTDGTRWGGEARRRQSPGVLADGLRLPQRLGHLRQFPLDR